MLEQPSPLFMLPSSQYSPKLSRASPQRSIASIMHMPPTPDAVGQDHPGSTRLQSAAQPSPPMVLPSSQASSPITCRSPHTMVERQAIPGIGQVKNGSSRHIPEQPSPGAMLPSS